ncbi:MAG: SLBB domain-containing protein, partial [Candidatus Helarchaeota archaeon]|nr:SLBB domain-containing protein [Candidatus Helarchaeota archaeon]
PLIGPFPVGNKTIEQARDEMREAFSQYYVNPQVQLRVMQFSSQKVYLMGAVKGKGLYSITKRVTLFEVITYMEDLLPDVDLDGAYLMRDGKMYPLHLERLMSGDLSTNYELMNNDILYLPSRKNMKVYALGEVMKPGMYEMERNDNVFFLLARAGGLSKGAQAKEVRIIRGGLEDPILITINIKPLVKRHAPSQLDRGTGSLTALAVSVDATRKNTVSLEKLYLKDGDIIFVPPTGLEHWNQIITKISPTLTFLTAPFVVIQDIVLLRTLL